MPTNDSASFPFRFIDVHAGAVRDRHREQFFEVPNGGSAWEYADIVAAFRQGLSSRVSSGSSAPDRSSHGARFFAAMHGAAPLQTCYSQSVILALGHAP